MDKILEYIIKNKIIIFLAVSILILSGVYLLDHRQQPVEKEAKTEELVTKKPVSKAQPNNQDIFAVDIQGAVKSNGVFRIKKGAIVQDVLKMAGGLNSNADVKQINQAQRVTDQMQIYVPTIGEKINVVNNGPNGKEGKQVNINTATVEDLKGVSGIGPKKAEKIISFREKNGNFKEIHDLTGVSGIGEKSLDSLKDKLTV